MNPSIDENTIISWARDVVLLMDKGDFESAALTFEKRDSELGNHDSTRFDVDVLALWEQVGIALANSSNIRYFEDVKDELNRVTFKYRKKH